MDVHPFKNGMYRYWSIAILEHLEPYERWKWCKCREDSWRMLPFWGPNLPRNLSGCLNPTRLPLKSTESRQHLTAPDSTMAMASAAQELATAVAVSTSAPQFLPLHSVHKHFTWEMKLHATHATWSYMEKWLGFANNERTWMERQIAKTVLNSRAFQCWGHMFASFQTFPNISKAKDRSLAWSTARPRHEHNSMLHLCKRETVSRSVRSVTSVTVEVEWKESNMCVNL